MEITEQTTLAGYTYLQIDGDGFFKYAIQRRELSVDYNSITKNFAIRIADLPERTFKRSQITVPASVSDQDLYDQLVELILENN